MKIPFIAPNDSEAVCPLELLFNESKKKSKCCKNYKKGKRCGKCPKK